ncbi:MAG: tyrosyl-tRNA synthetase, partial [Microgenomates group bacterium LiPW_31]
PLQIIKEHEKALQMSKVNPMELKKQLAFEIVKMYHGEKSAKNAEKEFKKVFQKREIPSKMPTFQTPKKSYNIIDLLVETKLAPSRSEAKRLIEQKAVELDGKLITNHQSLITIKNGMTIRVGKRRFIKIRL